MDNSRLMYNLLPSNPGVASTVQELLESRRAKFSYAPKRKLGRISGGHKDVQLINTLGSCLGIPVLFYVSFFIIAVYRNLQLNLQDLLSVLFIGVAVSVFCDVLIGLLYDRLAKLGLLIVRNLLTVFGTVCLVVSLAFLLRNPTSSDQALAQYRATIISISICYTLSNTTTVKNSANMTTTQAERSRTLFAEYFAKAGLLVLYICIPFWVRHSQGFCDCGDACSNSPGSATCLDCVNGCDILPNVAIYQRVSLGFTVFFGVFNIIAEFAVRTRSDEEFEDVPTTFNRRIAEVIRNKLLVKAFFIAVLQYTFLFAFSAWVYYYLTYRTTAQESCARFWGKAVYLCSKSWLKQVAVLLILLSSFIVYLVSKKKNISRFIATELGLVAIITGILLITFDFNEATKYFFVCLTFAVFFGSIAANKLLYTDGMFFDEYFSGVPHHNFPSALYNLAVKIGFFLALALHFTVFDPNTNANDSNASQYNSSIFGGVMALGALIIFFLNYFINRYELHAFDKIHVAIERNYTNITASLSFYDPIDKQPIRRPVVSHDSYERGLIRLLYNLGPNGDLKLAIAGKFSTLRTNGLIRMVLFTVLFIGSVAITAIFAKVLNTPYGWLVLIALVGIPVSIYGFVYNYNVFVAAGKLESPKYQGSDRSIQQKFLPLLENRVQPQPNLSTSEKERYDKL